MPMFKVAITIGFVTLVALLVAASATSATAAPTLPAAEEATGTASAERASRPPDASRPPQEDVVGWTVRGCQVRIRLSICHDSACNVATRDIVWHCWA